MITGVSGRVVCGGQYKENGCLKKWKSLNTQPLFVRLLRRMRSFRGEKVQNLNFPGLHFELF